MKLLKFKVNKTFGKHKDGDILSLKCDDNGKPLESYWFRRLKDSRIDNCISLVSENEPKKEAKGGKK